MKDYWTIKIYIFFIVCLALYIPISNFKDKIIDPAFQKWLDSRHEMKQQAFQDEVTQEVARRRAERKETDNNIVDTTNDSSVDTTNGKSTESRHVIELPQNSSNPPQRVIQSGQYKGMTPEEVQARDQLQFEYTLKYKAVNDKIMSAWDIRLKNTDDKKALMLSVFKSLSPEQLEQMRKESLKHLPAEDVNFFFDDVENKGSAKSDEQLIAEGERILKSEKSLDILFRELEIEKQEVLQDYKELFGAEMFSDDE